MRDWKPVEPIGAIAISNCMCGTSLSISSKGMNISTLVKLMNWAKSESRKRKVTISDILVDIRNEIDEIVLQVKK